MRRILYSATAVVLIAGTALAQGTSQNPSEMNKRGPATAQPSMQAPGQSQGPATQGTSTSAQQGVAPGIKSVDSASVRLTFYDVQPADMRASKLIGTDVFNLANENIGEVEDLIIDNGKTVKGVVISVGGFLGIGDRNVAVQPGSVVLTEQNDGSARVVINTTRDDLKNAPAFNFAEVDKPGSGAAGANTTGASPSRPAEGGDNSAPKR
jgi:sporulation protein YlmC with PRC-barrel domain